MTAVVTGIGVTAPNGLGLEDYWTATCGGVSGVAAITRFDATTYPARLAGEVPGFVAEHHLPSRLLPQTDHMTRLALVAADWALSDAGIRTDELPEFGMGVVTAASAGGFEFGQRELGNLWRDGGKHVSAYQSFAWFYAVNTGQISIRHGLRGPSGVIVSEQAGGLDAVAHARRNIRKGARLMLTGGVDGSICPWGWAAHLTSLRLSSSGDPSRAYLPFDAAACGHVPGEGGAILVLEQARAALGRGARIYGEIAGYAATFDPRPGGGSGSGLRRAIEAALRDAGATASEVDVVFADDLGDLLLRVLFRGVGIGFVRLAERQPDSRAHLAFLRAVGFIDQECDAQVLQFGVLFDLFQHPGELLLRSDNDRLAIREEPRQVGGLSR